MFGIPSCGECIEAVVFDDSYLGCGKPPGNAEILHDIVDFGIFFSGDGFGSGKFEDDSSIKEKRDDSSYDDDRSQPDERFVRAVKRVISYIS